MREVAKHDGYSVESAVVSTAVDEAPEPICRLGTFVRPLADSVSAHGVFPCRLHEVVSEI